MREKLRRLERALEEEMIVIPQKDGTVKKFPKSASKDAYLNLMQRLGAGEDAPPEHPLIEAARNSSDPQWEGTVYTSDTVGGRPWTDPVEDLSE